MSRLHFKGGPWTNAEDQVLQAALAQYGLRDWERAASMLTKKTAAQCRDRWENYLDPRLSIKEEWSMEEEEKLVELQTLFPNKWRLISEELTRSTPSHYIRPAWLCEQHYLEMRDQHTYQQLQAEGGPNAPTQSLEEYLSDRRRRRGAYQAHEERAARQDTVDGERFEKEMLDMAVSRLANQDQKKGLRKERQRQLEEASFLAKLESNREGIESGTLSARQRRRMERALQEDRQGRPKVLDSIVEEEDDDDEDDNEEDGGKGTEATPALTGSRGFTPIDMYEDQASAGIDKKQRKLMVDLTKQQRRVAEQQAEEGVRPTSGVNHDLLLQLAGVPGDTNHQDGQLLRGASSPLAIEAKTSTAGGRSVATTGSAMTWEALAGPSTDAPDLNDLFQSLPSVMPANATTSSSLLPATPAAAAAVVAPPSSMDGVFPSATAAPQPVQTPTPAAATSSSSPPSTSSGPLAFDFDAMPAPSTVPPRPEAPTKLSTHTASTDLLPLQASTDLLDTASSTYTLSAPPSVPQTQKPSPAHRTEVSPAVRSSVDDADNAVWLAKARQLIAVETERAMVTRLELLSRRRRRLDDEDADVDEEDDEEEEGEAPWTRATSTVVDTDAVAAARHVVEAAMVSESVSSPAPTLAEVVTAHQETPYWHLVNAEDAVHELEQRATAAVGVANKKLRAARRRVETMAGTCFVDGQDGRMKAYLRYGSGSTSGDGGVGPVRDGVERVPYLMQYWAGQLHHAQQKASFLERLRDEELQEMRRRVDERANALRELQDRERHLQAMYRQAQGKKATG